MWEENQSVSSSMWRGARSLLFAVTALEVVSFLRINTLGELRACCAFSF
jgi:hypothetical protein